MTPAALAYRGIRFHWRAYAGVFLGTIIATSILVGALAVGDSVRHTLRQMARSRLGGVHLALAGESRFFRADLARELEEKLRAPVVPVIQVRGIAAAGDSRVNRVQVLGVDERFFALSPSESPPPDLKGIVLNRRLADQLRARRGTEVLVRVEKPSLLSRDAPLSTVEDSTVALRMTVSSVADDSAFGRFSLEANQTPPLNAFVSLTELGKLVGMPERANLLLVGGNGGSPSTRDAGEALWQAWKLDDAGMKLRELPGRQELDLRTDRVFLDPPVGDAALRAYPGARAALTYFVNEIRAGGRSTPYSTVAALQSPLLPPDLKPDEALINDWLAQDLTARVGDSLTLRYWVVGPMRKLVEMESSFRVRGILPMKGDAVDPALMPDIPGLSDKKNCRDWEPGVPVDLDRIRDKDQAYWDAYRGSPKVFITLAAGQKIWDNRFGNLTSIRYPEQGRSRPEVETCIKQALTPAAIGLYFQPVRDVSVAAASPTLDFGHLFLGFSLFLIAAALILTALLFGFAVERRAGESGTLLAIGLRPARVRRLFLLEALGIATGGVLIGSVAAVAYTRAIVSALSGVWKEAVGGATIQFHVDLFTLLGGAAISLGAALASVWLASRRQARRHARELLSGGPPAASVRAGSARRSAWTLYTAVGAGLSGILLALSAFVNGGGAAAGLFFGAGFLLLVAGAAASRIFLGRLDQSAGRQELSLRSLGMRNAARRYGRSLAAVTLLACGSFLVVAVGANRHDPRLDAERRTSGTGGFRFYGESATPIFQDLNTRDGLDAFGLEPEDVKGARFVSMRVQEGDEASCLNLNRAVRPRILGVQPAALSDRGAFAFAQIRGSEGWSVLDQGESDGSIPAVGDVNTVVWSLGKGLGRTLDYIDERGRTRKLRIVGILPNSVLQGALIISENRFIEMFPSHSGYQAFLIDAPKAAADSISAQLTRATEDVGLSIVPTVERLAAFSAVENTYLSIFAALGALGLLLGSAGLGVVVLRNVLDRRSELAAMGAVGFRRSTLHRLIFTEHALVLAMGLGVGITAALVAVIPAILMPRSGSALPGILWSLGLVLISGLLWTGLAASLSLRGNLVAALRSE